MRRVLVCGGKKYADPWQFSEHSLRARAGEERGIVWQTLNDLDANYGGIVVINGGAKGADSAARDWSRAKEMPCITHPAKWSRHGKRSAGPIRNAEMLAMWKPDEVIAFPGGRGTADMVAKARAAGIPVTEIT